MPVLNGQSQVTDAVTVETGVSFLSPSDQTHSVAVIGANGFLGRRVVQMLAQSPGLRPVAVARRAGAGEVEWRVCDATDAAAVASAIAGCTYAVNCVAGDAETMKAATRNLCAVAPAAGLRRIVHLSSMAVYGPATGLVEEAHTLDAGGGWYGAAKIACEAMMADYTKAGGEGVILRPGCIHGPHSEQWTTRIGHLLRQHRIGDLGVAGDGACNLVYIDDVAAAVIAALRQPGAVGEAFNLGDPDPGTWNRYFLTFGRAIGATPVPRITRRRLKIEKLAAIPLKIAEKLAGRAGLGRLVPEAIPGSLMGLWGQDIQLDHRKADRLLGFTRTPPDQAIAAASSWFKAAITRGG
jgi:nucleoside-diphosphate-sugar epimerase